MKPNPYEPGADLQEERTAWAQFRDDLLRPTPVRAVKEGPFRWVVDAVIAFVVSILGFLLAAIIAEKLPFLGPMAYPTGLVIGLFPVALWMHYCGVGRGAMLSGMGALLCIMTLMAFPAGMNGILHLPFSFVVLAIVLPFEWMLGRAILRRLPGSSGRRKIATKGPHATEEAGVGPMSNGTLSPRARELAERSGRRQ